MAKGARSSSRQKRGNVLKLVMEKLEASLLPFKGVWGGHLVVVAAKGDEPKNFVICLNFLNDPEFLKLLKQAEEEFGFKQEGVLAIPCRPEELQRILTNKRTVV